MSGQITGGSVKYTVPSNYAEGRHGSEVTLNFSVAEGADYSGVANTAATSARSLAISMSTGQVAAPLAPAGGVPSVSLPATQVAPTPVVAPSLIPVVPPVTVAPSVPAVPVGPVVTPPASPSSSPPMAVVGVGPEGATLTAMEITENDLVAHMQKEGSRLLPVHGEATNNKLRELIMQFVPVGTAAPTLKLIPQTSRAMFVTALQQLV